MAGSKTKKTDQQATISKRQSERKMLDWKLMRRLAPYVQHHYTLLGLSLFFMLGFDVTGVLHPYLIKVVQQIRQMVLLLRATGLRDESAWDTIWSEHSQITKSLRHGDKASAVRCIRQHIKNAARYTTSVARRKGSRP